MRCQGWLVPYKALESQVPSRGSYPAAVLLASVRSAARLEACLLAVLLLVGMATAFVSYRIVQSPEGAVRVTGGPG